MTSIRRTGSGVSKSTEIPSDAGLTFYATDDPEAYDGAPVGLQIVARKYEEEKVWAIARIVDAVLKKI